MIAILAAHLVLEWDLGDARIRRPDLFAHHLRGHGRFEGG